MKQAGLTPDQFRSLLQEAVMARYTVVLTPEPEVGGYSVSVAALPGCFSQGESVEDALDHIREAIGLHLWGLQQDGDPIPHDVSPIIEAVDADPIVGHAPDEDLLAETDPKVGTTRNGAA